MGKLVPLRRRAPDGAWGDPRQAAGRTVMYRYPVQAGAPVPWPAYDGAHSRRRLGRWAVLGLLALGGLAAGAGLLQEGAPIPASACLGAAALGLGVAWRRLRAWERAVEGERAVARAIGRARDRFPDELGEAIHLADVAMRWGRFRWQIDHLVLTPGAIVILEVKRWSGWQLPLGGGRWWAGRSLRRSPLDQVRRQAALLEAWLSAQPGLPRIPVIPLVVWAASWKGMTPPPEGVVEQTVLDVRLAELLLGRTPQLSSRQLRLLAARLACADLGRGEVRRPCAG